MFDFIPIMIYNPLFFNLLLIFVVITFLHTLAYTGYTHQTFIFNKVFTLFLFTFFLMYTGLRPVSWVFGDMGMYALKFDNLAKYETEIYSNDIIFYSFMKFMASLELKKTFFFLITLFYITASYFTAKRLFPNYYFFAFLVLVGSFEYWSYGTNGIRNGLATSIILLSFTFIKTNKLIMYLLFFVAFNIHSSVLIPIGAYFLATIYKSDKLYFKIWFVSILLSLFIGNTIENFITNIGLLNDDVVKTYFQNKDLYASSFAYTGFRWDFLLYSSIAVFTAYYFIFVRKFNDPYYSLITNIYLISNSIWILVIEASFSNRFAYLSWFMMGLVIIYPLLKNIFFNNQFKIIGLNNSNIFFIHIFYEIYFSLYIRKIMKKITVFTPAFNRAYCIHQLYESLLRQTNQDFIWLVIDDGSTDNTKELVFNWQKEEKIEIKYIYQENQGMHGAHNTAYSNIKTELNICIDSDDYLTNNAIEHILNTWNSTIDKKNISGIVGLDIDKKNNIIGTELPQGVEFSTLYDIYHTYKCTGDKKLVFRTDIIKKYPKFPLFEGEKLVPLGILWLMIDQDYKLKCLNQPLCVVEYMPDGSTANIFKQYKNNPKGFRYSKQIEMIYFKGVKNQIKLVLHLISSTIYANDFKFFENNSKKILTTLLFPVGILFHLYIRYKNK